MKKIKILTVGLVLCISIFGLVGCGDKDDSESSATDVKSEEKADGNLKEDAKESVKYFGYSEKEAVEQLVKKGYSKKESEKALDDLKIDWVDQATKRGVDHCTNGYYSKAHLIDTLVKYDGFTKKQAEEGVEKMNHDWKQEAVKYAKDDVKTLELTKPEQKAKVKEFLLDKKFTEEEAEYGANNCGL